MRWRATTVALLIVAVACGGDDSLDTTSSAAAAALGPAATVEALFGFLASSDFGSTAPLVDEEQLAIFTAIEGASGDEVAEMLTNGVPTEVRDDFWRGFVSSLPALLEQTADRATVGSAQDLDAGFSAVPVGFSDSEEDASWIVRDEGGVWVIDLFATFGPAFGPNLADWFDALADGASKDQVRAAMARGGPSLELGLEAEPLGPLGEEAANGVRALLASVGA